MKYIINCGGEYKQFETPKHLTVVNGERIVDKTIRLLRENSIEDIYISSNNPIFDTCGVPRLENKNNTFTSNGEEYTGFWLDAFKPMNEPVCYIFGDVCFTKNAIKTIVENNDKGNILFGTSDALNEQHENWGEPFAYKVNDYETFFKGIEEVRKLYQDGRIKRHPIVWELYRYLHNLDINIQCITEDYVCIDDGTIDIDSPEQIERLVRND